MIAWCAIGAFYPPYIRHDRFKIYLRTGTAENTNRNNALLYNLRREFLSTFWWSSVRPV